jgi:hypothetical protein
MVLVMVVGGWLQARAAFGMLVIEPRVAVHE